jgi:hypothetical protein
LKRVRCQQSKKPSQDGFLLLLMTPLRGMTSGCALQ